MPQGAAFRRPRWAGAAALGTLGLVTGGALGAPRSPYAGADQIQYGAAFVAESVADAGAVCRGAADEPCIFGSGGGLAIRAGYRARSPWYFGGAYEFSRHDPSSLLRLAILQQIRAEVRRYHDLGRRWTPYVSAGAGAAVYGNEWGAETWGGVLSLGGGAEFELSPTTAVGGALGYRAVGLAPWTDSAGIERGEGSLGLGLAHVVWVELILEVRSPLARW